MSDCSCLGIIRAKKNPYSWIDAYTQENIKFESWSNSIDFTKPVACMGGNDDWNLDEHCIPFCIEPLPDVLSLVFTSLKVPNVLEMIDVKATYYYRSKPLKCDC